LKTKDNTYRVVSLLNKIRDKKVVDKALMNIMLETGMKKSKFYSIFQLACSDKLISQRFNGNSYDCSLTKKGKEELKLFKFMLKENYLKNKK